MSLRLQGIDSYYGKSKILSNVSLQVDEGEIVALMGRNGVGKTTTLRSIIGIVPSKKGRVKWQDSDITGAKRYRIGR
ncbi:MAG: ATP-binding cassette domain-containing protein, partial [Desulfobacula sp.]